MNNFKTKNQFNITLQGLFFIATLCTSSFTFTMNHTPLTNKERAILDNIDTHNISSTYPSIKILKKQPANIRLGTCHNYAISKSLGLEGEIPKTLPIVGTDDWHYALKFKEKYCREVSTPKKGDLVVYYANHWLLPRWLSPAEITHTGIVQGDDIVESKWGTQTTVLSHPTLHVPKTYGDTVKYYRIEVPTDEIIEDLKRTIYYYSNYSEVCGERNRKLVEYAEQGNNKKVWEQLQFNMCTSVKAKNAEGQSLLMIGAKTNNYELVKIAVDYGANLKRKDFFGKTAFDLAIENNNKSIAKVLQLLQKETPQPKKPLLYRTLKHMVDPTKTAQENFWQTMHS